MNRVLLLLFCSSQLWAADDRYYEIVRSAVNRSEQEVQTALAEHCQTQASELERQRTQLEGTLPGVKVEQRTFVLEQLASLARQASAWRSILLPEASGAVANYYRSQKVYQANIEATVQYVRSQVAPVSASIAIPHEELIRTTLLDQEKNAWRSIVLRQTYLHENMPGADFIVTEPVFDSVPESSATDLAWRLAGDAQVLMGRLAGSGYRKARRFWQTGNPFQK